VNRRWTPGIALVVGGSAILLLALWLRNPLLPYGGEAATASGTEARTLSALSALRGALENNQR